MYHNLIYRRLIIREGEVAVVVKVEAVDGVLAGIGYVPPCLVGHLKQSI